MAIAKHDYAIMAAAVVGLPQITFGWHRSAVLISAVAPVVSDEADEAETAAFLRPLILRTWDGHPVRACIVDLNPNR